MNQPRTLADLPPAELRQALREISARFGPLAPFVLFPEGLPQLQARGPWFAVNYQQLQPPGAA